MEQRMQVQEGIPNRFGQRKDGQQKGSPAGDCSGALVFDLSVGTSPQTLSVLMDIFPVQGVVFGCSGDITVTHLAGASGLAGFSRGPLSLVSQLNISSFTYFIAPPDNATGKSFLSWSGGAAADLDAPAEVNTGGRRSSTPLLAAKENQNPDLYYVKLTGVPVDGELLTAIPAGTFDVRADGSGGLFLSTTLPVTYLEEAAYTILRTELVARIQSQGVDPVSADDHLCYLTHDFSNTKFPVLALVFDGANATMELKVENYFLAIAGGQLTCLTILPSTGGSILGSLMQAGRTMTYDILGGQLSFQTAAVSALAPARVSLVVMVTLVAWVLAAQSLF
jgi:hypothetical protein